MTFYVRVIRGLRNALNGRSWRISDRIPFL